MMTRHLTCVAIFCIGCSGDDGADRDGSSSAVGGTVVISVSGDPETLLPPLGSTVSTKLIADLVYDRLAEIGDSLNTVGDGGFTPRLAKSWEWSADSTSIAFHLDGRARWHDGRAVSARDVVYTWRIYSDSATASPYASAISSIDSVTVRDSLTAVFWFGERSPLQFYDAVNAMSILPEHAIGSARGAELRSSALGRSPIGTGRFRFVRWDAGASIEVAADTANYRGRARLDRVIMAIAPDFNAALTRLLGGEADVLEQVPAVNLEQIEADTSISVMMSPGLDYNFVQFNLRNPRNLNAPHPVFADRNVRVALSAAVDRRRIVENAYGSLSNVALGPTVRAYPTTDTSLRQIAFSPENARRTLDSTGWRAVGSDGIRVRNGQRLEFSLTVPATSKSRNTMAVLIQEQLKQVGAKVNIDRLDLAAFINRQRTRQFDAVFGGWHVEPSPGGIRQTWGIAGSRGAGTNYGSYENALFNSHVDNALASNTVAERRRHFSAAYQTIIDDAPAIWLAEPKRVMAIHKRIETRRMRADSWWANIADWTIPPARRIARDRAAAAR